MRRQLYILCGCISPLMICFGIVYSMFSLFLGEELNIAKHQIGFLYMLGSSTGFLGAPFIGRLSDRYGRKVIILSSIAGFVLVFLLWSVVHSYIPLLLIQVLEGLSWVAIGVSATAYIADICPPEGRGWAMGVYQRTMSLGWIAGPAIGGFLFEKMGFQLTFLLCATFLLIGLIPTFFLLKEPKVQPPLKRIPNLTQKP